VYADPATGEAKGGKTVFEDNYQKVGDFQLLSQRITEEAVADGINKTEFNFSNMELLPAVVAVAAAAV
jgi:hypothetical protein